MTPEERAFRVAHGATAQAAPGSGPRRRLSPARVLVVLLVLAAATASTVAFRTIAARTTPTVYSAFMPYVDATATPQYAFENGSTSSIVLGFVVSAKGDACAPSWGGAYSLGQAADALDLDRRIARFRDRAGQVAVSFGGAANSELADGCTNASRLAAAYGAVVSRYGLRTVDLDLESPTALSTPVMRRRAAALQQVQQAARKAHRPVQIWLTLPVAPDGLTATGRAALATLLAAKVQVAGVNGLIMDYGSALPRHTSLTAVNENALVRLAAQVRSGFAHAGRHVSSAQSWQFVGATPMIGQNDTTAQRFSLRDASSLVSFASRHHLRRLSMWSLNRDLDCGPNYADPTIVSSNCSGVTQRVGQFAEIFRHFSAGPAVAAPSTTTPQVAPSVSDDPATSPYAIWNDVSAYAAGTKIVWHHNVYLAKWWTQGDVPDAPVSSTSQTPWTLIGPVLPGEHPAPTPTVAAGTYPAWSAGATYRAGARVIYDHVGYQAKWYTHGDVPGIPVRDPGQTPWELITSK